jgi:hypothetical protein
MKIILLLAGIFLASCSNAQQMNNSTFIAERTAKTATILLNDRVDKVFPLFGAFEERKWSDGWHPTLIYPQKEIIEEGTIFRTPGHGHGESEFIWTVSKYDQARFLIQYLVYSSNRIWTITIICNAVSDHTSSAQITYSFTGLNEAGNEINEHFLSIIYQHDLSDWADDINHYLQTKDK